MSTIAVTPIAILGYGSCHYLILLDSQSADVFGSSQFTPTCSACSTAYPAPGVTAVRGDSAFAICRECHGKMSKYPYLCYLFAFGICLSSQRSFLHFMTFGIAKSVSGSPDSKTESVKTWMPRTSCATFEGLSASTIRSALGANRAFQHRHCSSSIRGLITISIMIPPACVFPFYLVHSSTIGMSCIAM